MKFIPGKLYELTRKIRFIEGNYCVIGHGRAAKRELKKGSVIMFLYNTGEAHSIHKEYFFLIGTQIMAGFDASLDYHPERYLKEAKL